MKVLWTANLIPANVAQKLGMTSEVLGGWVESMLSELSHYENLEVALACKCDEKLCFKEKIDNVVYYSLGYSSSTSFKALKFKCSEIIEDFKPDVINIEGTEFLHARAMQCAAKEKNIPVAVSLKGVLNGQYDYQCGSLAIDDMMFSKSLTNIFAAWIMHLRKTMWFKPRLKAEKEIIGDAEYIIGRTTWDRAHSYAINPKAEYFFCNENLREPFYSQKWDIESMQRHSIYVGNGYSALKGFHFLIKALPQLIREYPDLKVYVAGYKPYTENDKRSFIKKGYSSYLKKLIKDLGVEKHIEFTGPLNSQQVAEMLSKVNIYVLCSTIENSPNTLGEAMTVGTPCIASYVGGVPDMAEDGKEALFFRSGDPQLIAWNIKKIFDDDTLAVSLSENGHRKAIKTHDTKTNVNQLIKIYEKICK